jgi:tetratricopeptide (TPR) repeat protein
MRQIVYESEHQTVVWMPGQGDVTYVTFGELTSRPNGCSFWGDKLFESKMLPAIGFVAKASNWYPIDDTLKAIDVVQNHCRINRVLCYGFSMGAYAALKFSKALHSDAVVAFSPQYSISPTDVGNSDTRYLEFFAPSIHRDMALKSSDMIMNTTLFVDMNDRVDALHARYIERLCHIDIVLMASLRHDTVRLVSEAGVAHDIFSIVLRDPPGLTRVQALRKVVRGVRRKSSTYWLNTGRRIIAQSPQRVEKWQAAYLTAHQLRPQNPSAIVELCRALTGIGRSLDIRPYTQQLVKAAELPQYQQLVTQLFDRAIAAAQSGKLASPIIFSDRLSPTLLAVRFLAEVGDVAGAKEALDTAIDSDVASASVFHQAADVARSLGLYGSAVTAIHRLVEIDGFTSTHRLLLAEMLMLKGSRLRAKTVLRELEAEEFSDPYIIRLWNVLRSVGLYEIAAPYAVRIAEQAPRDAFRRLHLVNSLLDIGQLQEAAYELNQALTDAAALPLSKDLSRILFSAWSVAVRGKLGELANRAAQLYLATTPIQPVARQVAEWLESQQQGVGKPT